MIYNTGLVNSDVRNLNGPWGERPASGLRHPGGRGGRTAENQRTLWRVGKAASLSAAAFASSGEREERRVRAAASWRIRQARTWTVVTAAERSDRFLPSFLAAGRRQERAGRGVEQSGSVRGAPDQTALSLPDRLPDFL